MKLLRECIRMILAENDVKFEGILKLMPSPQVVDAVSSLAAQLPLDAVVLADNNFHVTLVHQSVLKPYRKQIKQLAKEGNLPSSPIIILEDVVEERGPDAAGRKSWTVWLKNQDDMRNYVNQVMDLIGAPQNPEPSRRFHVSIANLTGKTGDSVR